MAKKGILLLNIGSPASYEVEDVKKYLKKFLMDKDVINVPFPVRWFLVNCLIVPKRAPYSAANYKKIWFEGRGSPLTVHTEHFAQGLQQNMGAEYLVRVGMRYAEPSIARALADFQNENIKDVLAVPLFPQHAEATTGSSLQEIQRQIQQGSLNFNVKSLPPFYGSAAFIENTVRVIQKSAPKLVDHYLFSYHGLPESHVRKVEGCLKSANCCLEPRACEKNCYRAQCVATTQKLARQMGLSESQWSLSFQSRLGRAEWIKPATDQSIEFLAKKGIKNLAVVCPSFVADCLETLEEIGIGAQELFKEHGGENFYLIPCLNDDKQWTTDFAKLIKDKPGMKSTHS
jgi:ferrochelatase